MYCQNCGKKIPKGNKFCPYCGHPVDGRIHINSSTQLNLRPKRYSYSPDSKKHNYNPKHISKKAKLLLGCIFAVALIGGAYHIHYIHSPQSVNLEKQIDDHSYRMKSVKIPYVSDTGSFSKERGAFYNGKLRSDSDNNSSDGVPYEVQGKTLKIFSDQNANSSDSDASQDAVNFKLNRVSDGGKDLSFGLSSYTQQSDANAVPHTYNVSHIISMAHHSSHVSSKEKSKILKIGNKMKSHCLTLKDGQKIS